MAKRFVRRILVVRAHKDGERFPIDMLRYSQCAPATEADAHKVERAIAFGALAEDITLHRYAPWSGGKVGVRDGALGEHDRGRWESFHWSVISDVLDEGCR